MYCDISMGLFFNSLISSDTLCFYSWLLSEDGHKCSKHVGGHCDNELYLITYVHLLVCNTTHLISAQNMELYKVL